ncbi:putative cell wall protein ecm33 precursor [Diplodia seriata]|uniref:Putative cell wall protein ecm33 n=1 Tax=Diplodia seriata TaxID=420778 RepID=A0A0G2EGF1_9PEZI|nr:putative cell wall protein ecm33 precursor [Diplodia seriata]
MAAKTVRLALISALVGVVAGQNATLCSSAATKTISSRDEANKIGAACPTFTGSISLSDGPLYSDLSFNGVKEITGKLISKDWMTVTADSLERIGDAFENIDSYTTSLDFPKLAYVGAGMIFTESDQYRPGLQHVKMPNLKEVNGDLLVTGNHYFSELQIPNIERINGLFHIEDEHALYNLSLDKLATVGPGGIDFAGTFWDGISLASIKSVYPKFNIIAMSTGNCSEWDALRQPGGALANTEDYYCHGGCKRLYGKECYST